MAREGPNTSETPVAESGGWPSEQFFHKLQQTLTALILISFALIVVMTTASTGPFVVVTGKFLFLLILFSAAIWVATWLVKVWQEKRPSASD